MIDGQANLSTGITGAYNRVMTLSCVPSTSTSGILRKKETKPPELDNSAIHRVSQVLVLRVEVPNSSSPFNPYQYMVGWSGQSLFGYHWHLLRELLFPSVTRGSFRIISWIVCRGSWRIFTRLPGYLPGYSWDFCRGFLELLSRISPEDHQQSLRLSLRVFLRIVTGFPCSPGSP